MLACFFFWNVENPAFSIWHIVKGIAVRRLTNNTSFLIEMFCSVHLKNWALKKYARVPKWWWGCAYNAVAAGSIPASSISKNKTKGIKFKLASYTKIIGDIGVSVVISEFLKHGINVLLPYDDNSPYDIVIYVDDKFYKINV